MILLIAVLVWPVFMLVCVLSFRRTIANVLNSADEAEIGPHGVKWRKSSQQNQANDLIWRGLPGLAIRRLVVAPEKIPGQSRQA